MDSKHFKTHIYLSFSYFLDMLQDDLHRRRRRNLVERRGPTHSAQLSIKEKGVERNEWQKFKDLDAEPCRDGLNSGNTNFESDDSISKNIAQYDSSTELNSKIWHSEIKKLASIARITALRRLKDNSHLFLKNELYVCSKKSLPDKECTTSSSNHVLKSLNSNNSLSEILAVQAQHIKKLSQDIKLKLGINDKLQIKSSNEDCEVGNTEKIELRNSTDGHNFTPRNDKLNISSDKSETFFNNNEGHLKNITRDGRDLGLPLLSHSDKCKQQNCNRYILECDPAPKTLLKNTKRIIKDITNFAEIQKESGHRTGKDFKNSRILSSFANTEKPISVPSLNSDSVFSALQEITDIYGPCRKKSNESICSVLTHEDSESLLLSALMEFHKDFASENNKNLEEIMKINDEISRCKKNDYCSKGLTCFKAANRLRKATSNSQENLLGLPCSRLKYAEKPFEKHSLRSNFSKRLKRNFDQNYETPDLNDHISPLSLLPPRKTSSGNNAKNCSNDCVFSNYSSENLSRKSPSCSKNVNKNPILNNSTDYTNDNPNKKSSARSIFSTKSLNPNSQSDSQPVNINPKDLVALMKKSYKMSEVIYSSEPEQEEEPNQGMTSPQKQNLNIRKLDKTRKIQKAKDELISERDELMKFKSKMLSKVEIYETHSSKNVAESQIIEQDFKQSKKEMMNKKSIMLENVNDPKHAQEFLSDLSLLKTKYIKLIGFQNSLKSCTSGETFFDSCKSQTTQDRDSLTNNNVIDEQEQICSQLDSSSKVLKNQLVILKDHLGAILGNDLFKKKELLQQLDENISESLGKSNIVKTPKSPTTNTENVPTQTATNKKLVVASQDEYLKTSINPSSVKEPTIPLPANVQSRYLQNEPGFEICAKDKPIHESTTNNEVVFVNQETNQKQSSPEHVILTSSGKPVRLFNKAGYPLTDRKGRRLKNNLGVEMLPESDLLIMQQKKFQVFDAFNYLPGSSSFDPSKTATPTTQHEIQIIDKFTNPTKLYNSLGLPLSDCEGYILRDNHGNFVVVLDSIGIPMCCTNGEPIYMEDGKLWILEKDSYDVLHKGNFNKLKKVLDRTYFNINDNLHNGNLNTDFDESKRKSRKANVTSELMSKTDSFSIKNEEDKHSKDKLSLLSVSSLLNIKNSLSPEKSENSKYSNKCNNKPNKLSKMSSTYELLHSKTDSTNLFKKLKGRSKPPIETDKIMNNYNVNPAIIQLKQPPLANIKNKILLPHLLQLHLSSFGTDVGLHDELQYSCKSTSSEKQLYDDLFNHIRRNKANGDFSRSEKYEYIPKGHTIAEERKKIKNHRHPTNPTSACSAIDPYKKKQFSNANLPLKGQNQRKNIMIKKGIKKSIMKLADSWESNNEKGSFRQIKNVKKKNSAWKPPRRPLYFEI